MGTVSQLKIENTLRVFRLLCAEPNGVTRPELAARARLTNTTVQSIICELKGRGVVCEEGDGVSTGGRKAQRFSLHPAYKAIIGVYLRTDHIRIGLFDYRLRIVHSESHPFALSSCVAQEGIGRIATLVQALLRSHGLQAGDVAGVGISVPGPVEYESGRVHELAGCPQWAQIPLRDRLEQLVGIPVTMDKDVSAGAAYLRWNDPACAGRNILYVALEGGVGSALLIHGEVYRSTRGMAGEIGHIALPGNELPCACGGVGCLETIVSDFAILEEVRAAKGLCDGELLDMNDVMRWDAQGDEAVRRVLLRARETLAGALRDAMLLYDPDEICINCAWMRSNPVHFEALQALVHRQSPALANHGLQLSLVTTPDFGLISAAAQALHREAYSAESSILRD